MRAPASVFLLCVFLIPACAAAPKPVTVVLAPAAAPSGPVSALSSSAPATTRVLFRVASLRDLLAADRGRGPKVIAMKDECGVDVAHDFGGIEGWITEAGEVRVEVKGAITLEKIACLAASLGFPVGGVPAELALGPMRVTGTADGVIVRTAGAVGGHGAPGELVQRFNALVAARSEIVVATSAGTPRFEATSRYQSPAYTIELRVGNDQATRAAAVLAPLLVRSKHTSLLEGVTVAAVSDRLVVRLEDHGASPIQVGLALRADVVEAFNTPSQSMSPTLLLGDHFMMVKDVPGRPPERGEIVVFEHEAGTSFVKRVVGLPGDHLVITGDAVTVNGARVIDVPAAEVVLEDRHDGKPQVRGPGFRETIGEHSFTVRLEGDPRAQTFELTVPADTVFVLGDNRHNSIDSRQFGPVPFSQIRGRATVIHLSIGGDGIRWERLLMPVE